MDEQQADAYIGECLNVFFLCVPRDEQFDPAAAMDVVFQHVSAEAMEAADLEHLQNYCRESLPAALAEDHMLHFHHKLAHLTKAGKEVWDTLHGNGDEEKQS